MVYPSWEKTQFRCVNWRGRTTVILSTYDTSQGLTTFSFLYRSPLMQILWQVPSWRGRPHISNPSTYGAQQNHVNDGAGNGGHLDSDAGAPERHTEDDALAAEKNLCEARLVGADPVAVLPVFASETGVSVSAITVILRRPMSSRYHNIPRISRILIDQVSVRA